MKISFPRARDACLRRLWGRSSTAIYFSHTDTLCMIEGKLRIAIVSNKYLLLTSSPSQRGIIKMVVNMTPFHSLRSISILATCGNDTLKMSYFISLLLLNRRNLLHTWQVQRKLSSCKRRTFKKLFFFNSCKRKTEMNSLYMYSYQLQDEEIKKNC